MMQRCSTESNKASHPNQMMVHWQVCDVPTGTLRFGVLLRAVYYPDVELLYGGTCSHIHAFTQYSRAVEFSFRTLASKVRPLLSYDAPHHLACTQFDRRGPPQHVVVWTEFQLSTKTC